MTAQINDGFTYRGRDYSLAGISEGELFDVSLLGLEPVPSCTACWRGYQAIFAVAKSRLVLDTLRVSLPESAAGETPSPLGPEINGVRPHGRAKKGFDFFNNHYVGLNYHLEYTGGLLLADGFIDQLYVHMGFHPAWKYERVIELIFEGGLLTAEHDRSERMAEIREMLAESRDEHSDDPADTTQSDIRQFIQRAFDRRYEM
jgi:hypothetical protein